MVVGGGRPAGLDKGFYFEPTILVDVAPDSTIAQEEVFGPVLSVLRYRGDDEAVKIANNSRYGLSGAVWGTDVDRALAVARRVRTGQIAVNGSGPGGAPRRIQAERNRPRKWRHRRGPAVHGAQGGGTAGVTRSPEGPGFGDFWLCPMLAAGEHRRIHGPLIDS